MSAETDSTSPFADWVNSERMQKLLWSTKFIITILAALVSSAFFLFVAGRRVVARDEGFYLMAAKLVEAGQIPYLDFFYPQMPLFPYFLSLFGSLYDQWWIGAREFSGLCATLLSLALFWHLKRRFQWIVGILGLVLFIVSVSSFGWYTIAKPYGLGTLLVFSSYLALSHFRDKSNSVLLTAGILFGLAVNCRLIFAAAFPAIFLVALSAKNLGHEPIVRFTKKSLFSGGLLFCLGMLISFLPAILLYMSDAQSFHFNNLGYHFLRRDDGISIDKKLETLWALISINHAPSQYVTQLKLLLWFTLLHALYRIVKGRLPSTSFGIALLLFVANALPTPMYLQYFSVLTPFLIVCSFEFCADLFASFSKDASLLPYASMVVLLLLSSLLYTGRFAREVRKYCTSGRMLITRDTGRDLKISEVHEVSREIESLIPAEAKVLSPWPGYLIDSPIKPIHGAENQFAAPIAQKIEEQDQQRYHLLSYPHIFEKLESHEIDLVVVQRVVYARKYKRALKRAEYKLIKDFGFARIYAKPGLDIDPEVGTLTEEDSVTDDTAEKQS